MASVTVNVANHFSDPEGGSLTYEAESVDETIATVSVDTSMVTIEAVAGGSTTIQVTALDTAGNRSTATQDIVVTVNSVPTAAAGDDQRVPEGATVTLFGSGTDPDGDSIATYTWTQTRGPSSDLARHRRGRAADLHGAGRDESHRTDLFTGGHRRRYGFSARHRHHHRRPGQRNPAQVLAADRIRAVCRHGADYHRHAGGNTAYEAAPGALLPSHFSVTDTVDGTVSVSGVTRDSATVATLTLAYSGEDITANGTLSVTVAAAGHTGVGDLTTNTINITASAGVNVCGRTPRVRAGIVAASPSRARECTSITDLATIRSVSVGSVGNQPSITSLQPGDFAGLTALRSLALQDHDELEALPPNIFAGLTALRTLNLRNNNLKALPANIFAGLPALGTLFLSNNNLKALPANIFDGLDSLSTLWLFGNDFTVYTGLPAGIFADVLDTLGDITIFETVGLVIDDTVRNAHFVCSQPDAAAIAAFAGIVVADIRFAVNACLLVSTAQFNAYIAQNGATLSNLTISDGALTPVFAPATADYTVTVLNSVTAVTVTPAAGDVATITVNGAPVVSGTSSEDIDLPTPGMAVPITIEVTSAGIMRPYRLMVTRTAPPGITGIALTSNAGDDNVYANGDVIEATVTFSKAVTVTGQPQLALTVGAATRQAVYDSDSSTTTALVFSYTVAGDDEDDDGVSIGSNALNHPTGAGGSTILDADDATTDALITHSVTVDAPNAHAVDGIVPRVNSVVISSVTGPYARGEAIALTATFSEAVTVVGTPQIALAVGTATRQAVYDSGSSTTTALVFSYTVITNDSDDDGVEVEEDALTANSGLIGDAAGNEAVLAHAPIVAADVNQVDTAAPTFSVATINGATLTLTYNEALDDNLVSVPAPSDYTLTLESGAALTVNPDGVAINGATVTLTLSPAVVSTDVVTLAYTAGLTPLRDLAGNRAADFTAQALDNTTDALPSFGAAAVAAQIYTVGVAVDPVLQLPAASGGNGALRYTLAPALPDGLTFNAENRQISGTPTAATPLTTYTLTATDADAIDPDSATLTLMLTVTSLPDTTFTVPEDAAADTEVGSPLTPSNFPDGTQAWSITADNDDGVFAIGPTDGQLTVIEPLDFETTPTYMLTVQLTVDVATAQATVTITVEDVNEAPITVGRIDPQMVTIGGVASVTVNVANHFSDPDDDDSLTYHAISADENTATVSVQGSIVTISAVAVGDTTIRVTASDSSDTDSNQSRATQEIAVTVNLAPSLSAITFTVPEDAAADDSVGSPLTPSNFPAGAQDWSITAGNDDGVFAINPTTGQLTVIEPLDFETTASYTLTVQLTVGAATAQATVTITVEDVNEAPITVGSIDRQTVTIGGVASVTVNVADHFSDPDGDSLTYHAISADENTATVSVQGSIVTISAVAVGDTTIRVTAADASDTSSNESRATQDIAVTVQTVEAVLTGTLTEEILNGATVTVTLANTEYAPDAELADDDFRLATTENVPGVTVSGVRRDSATEATLTLAYGGADFTADGRLSVTVLDSGHTGSGDLDAGSILVTAINPALVLTAPTNQRYPINQAIPSLTLSEAIDIIGTATYTLTGPGAGPGDDDLPAGLAFTPADRVLSGTPTAEGVTTLTYTVTDSAIRPTTSVTFDVTIAPLPPAPTLAGTLTEANLFAATATAPTVTVTLENTEYAAPGTLLPSHFSLTDTVAGTVSVSSVTRDSNNTVATLTLAYSGEDITADGTLSVTLAAAGHTGVGALMTNTILIAASTGTNVCGRTAQVRDGIVGVSSATECTSITDLATITSLPLGDQGIASLQNGDFAGLTGLTELLLFNNALTTLPADIFAGLSALVELNLFNSNLNTLPPTVFAGLTSVENLFINRNNLASLPVGIFDGLNALENLALAFNPFTAGTGLPTGIFDDVLDTLGPVAPSGTGGVGLAVDTVGRAAHFVCSRDDAAAIVLATTGVTDCLRINTAQLNTHLAARGATLAGTLTEATLFDTPAPTVTVTLANTAYAVEGTLAQSHFSVTDTVDGTVSVSDFTRDSATVATLTLAYSGEDITTTTGTLSVTLAAAGHSGTDDLVTGTIDITASVGANVCGRTAQVRDEIVRQSSATECTSITDLASITRLELSGEGIASLQNDDFAGLTALEDLNLQFNDLEALPATIFAGLTALRDLGLDDNALDALPPTIFAGLTGLRDLGLDGNSLDALPATIFAGLTALQVLDLEQNNLDALPATIFDGLTVLQDLDLVQNPFMADTGLPAGIFDDVLDTLGAIGIDQTARDAHFVCSRPDFAAIVTAIDGVTDCLRITTAQLNAYNLADATLSDLTLSPGPLDPAFDSAITTYNVSVAANVESITVTPIANQSSATITVNGDSVDSGSDSAPIALSAGMELDIDIEVTAADTTTTMTYTVTATRAAAVVSIISIAAGPSPVTEGATATFTLTATPAPASDLTVQVTVTDSGAFIEGTAPPSVTITAATTTATLTVRTTDDSTDEVDGTITATVDPDPGYTVDATADNASVAIQDNDAASDATLSALTVSPGTLTPAFDPAVDTYTVTVANSVESVTVRPTATDAGATITVNGTPVNSDSDSAPIDLGIDTPVDIEIEVTAADTTTAMTYTVTATREAAPAAAVLTGTLTEANLFAATAPTVTVTLANTAYEAAPGTLLQSHFSVTDTVDGTVSVSDFTRDSATEATLTLAYSGEDITTTGTLSVTLAAAGHTVADDLMTSPIDITASTGANICGRTSQVRDEIVSESSATECTSITDLATITRLALDRQSIASLQPGDFAGLTALQDLDLQFNDLEALPATIFAGLTALQILSLSANDLEALPATIFAGLTGLQRLFLTDNALEALPANIFAGLTALQFLGLDDNDLDVLPATIFDGLERLSTLRMYANSFTADTGLPAGIFDDVLDTLSAITTDTNLSGFVIDQTVRAAHFVCSRPYFAAIVAVTDDVTDCLRISSAQFNTASPLVRMDATLSGLTLSDGTLDPVFVPGTTTYTVSVDNSVTSVTVTPTATVAVATITVNGDTVTSGSASDAIDLTAGAPMVIPIVVTAADTTTTQAYTVTVNRAPSAEAGEDQSIPEGDRVTLAGSGTDPDEGDSLTYSWTQIGGPSVTLSATNEVDPTFTAPFVTTDTGLTFSLVVSDGNADSAPDDVIITVTDVVVSATLTVTSPLTEAALFASTLPTVTVTLVNTEYEATLTPADFTVSDTLAGGDITLDDVNRGADGTTATLTLGFAGADLTADGDLSVTVTAAGHTGTGDLPAGSVSITASTGVNVCGRTAQVRDGIVGQDAIVRDSSATECTSITELASITVLDLGGQSIVSLQLGDFAGLTALQALDLFNNHLKTLPADIFAGLTSLQGLGLGNNDLEALPADIFDDLTALEILGLGNNVLEFLPATIFDDLDRLSTLGIFGNQFTPNTGLPAGTFDDVLDTLGPITTPGPPPL